MNVLIVDDNKNNRMIVNLLLEDYMEDNAGTTFEIDEANDGLEAVNKCRYKNYELVLMDIMMPNMDGVEATKIIRNEHKNIMIIAISGSEDSSRQKLILNNGAEDYISKPVNSDIFNTRISNYVTLIKSRENHASANESSVNLFTKEVYSRYVNFIFSSEDSLSEFWEFYLLDGEEKYDNLSDVVRAIFAIGEVQTRLGLKSNVIVEESESFIFFTMRNIDKLPSAVVPLILKKNAIACENKTQKDRLSFKLKKVITQEIVIEMAEVKIVEPEEPEEISSQIDYSSVALEVFDYIEDDDLMDLEEYAGKLGSLMLMVGGGDATNEEITEIYTFIEKLGGILSSYSEVYPISQALTALSIDLSSHIEEFSKNSEALGPMCAAFSRDLTSWIDKSFHTGAPSADFMNDTIVVNCETIGSMLKMDEAPAGDEDFDDIFDF